MTHAEFKELVLAMQQVTVVLVTYVDIQLQVKLLEFLNQLIVLQAEGKGELLKVFQDLHSFSDSMDICKFSSFSENAEHYAEQYGAMTGISMTADDVMKAGERIYNLERYYNNLAGFDKREDDFLPKRFTEEPATGNSAGLVSRMDIMLEEYYDVRGWKDGVVPEEKLRELEIITD